MFKKFSFLALFLAAIFESAIFAEVPGIGYFFFWSSAFLASIYVLYQGERAITRNLWMFLPSLLLAFTIFRYNAHVVQSFGVALCLLFLLWAVVWNLVSTRDFSELSRVFPKGVWNPLKIGREAKDGFQLDTGLEPETKTQVLRGGLFALVLLGVFGALLAQADAVFGAMLSEFGGHFSVVTPSPVIRVVFWTLLFLGSIKVWRKAPRQNPLRAKSVFSSTELLIAFGSLNGLLMGFLLIQARYLFGDSSLVEALGISHASYARKGFFELSLCIALILPLVMLAYQAAETHQDSRLRFLGGGLILSAFGLAVSALQRMLLYIDIYGLSVERFYAAAGILVAMIILLWAAYCCLSPKPLSWLLSRQLVTVVFLLGFLGLFDVESMVCRSHLNLVENGVRTMDSYYLGQLSSDTLPTLREYKDRLSGDNRKLLERVEREVLLSTTSPGGLSFNLSRQNAGARQQQRVRSACVEITEGEREF